MTRAIPAALDSVRGQRAFLAVVTLAVLVFAVLAARWRPLWYDELFTLYVAGEPSVADTVRALLAGADTNPPLDYLLRHLSLAWFGTSPEAFRWPSAAAFVAGLLAIYAYVRRRAPFLASAAAFLLPIGTAAVYYSYEGRAYALLFASAAIALWAWQVAVDQPRRPWRSVLLFAALCLGPYSHYYGVLNLVPVAAGEAWRSYRRRRMDGWIAVPLAGACVAMLGLLPFARTAQAMQGSFWASGYAAADLLEHYRGFLAYGGAPLLVVLAAVVLVAVTAHRRAPAAVPAQVPSHEVVAAVVLALTPAWAYLLAELVTGTLTSKYSIAMVAGVAIVAGQLLARAAAWWRTGTAILVAVLALVAVGQHVRSALAYRAQEPVPAELRRVLQAAPGPIAFDSPHQFLELVHYAPQLAAGRFVYPMDAATALEVRGFNNDEIALRRLARIRPLALADYREFTQRYPRFTVVFSERFWPGLVRALQRDGFCLAEMTRTGTTRVLRAVPGCRPVAPRP